MELGLLVKRVPFDLCKPVLLFFFESGPLLALKLLGRRLVVLRLALGRGLAAFGTLGLCLGLLLL